MTLVEFEELAVGRRAVRHFRPDAIDPEVLKRLLHVAHWAPSGYNLQPTHLFVVTDTDLKRALFTACMDQRQVLEAHATVVFTGDRRVMEHNFEDMLALELAAGTITPEYETKLRHYVPLAFGQGPAGLGWLWKAALAPIARMFMPTPSIPAVHKRYWLSKQVSLAAMQFMLAAHAAGLATVPMEGFDEGRVRRALGIPASHIVPIIVPVGHAADLDLKKTRLPLERFVHQDRW